MKKVDFLIMPVLAVLLLLVSCQNIDDYRRERVEKADKAFQKIKSRKFPDHKLLTLPFCIETALTNNLDLKVYELKSKVDAEKKTAAMLGMLPDLVVTNDITARDNQPGASSQNIQTGVQSLAPSRSTEKWENRVRVEMLFSIIDFGLSYLKSVQQEDRSIITTEQKRRAAQNLILDVTRAYFRVASAQYAMEQTEQMIKLSVETENLLQDMAKNKKVPLVRVLEENKKFIILKKTLMEYRRSYQNSCIELRSLMGYYPTDQIVVDTSAMNELVKLSIPPIELLEEASLLERPELYQLDIQEHITLTEARKTILLMFPNVRIFVDFTNSSNPFLYNRSWWEIGARAAYHLLRVPQQIEEYMALDAEQEQLQAQVMALSVGILAQVRIAHANFIEVKQRYDLAEDLFEVYEKHENVAKIKAESAGALSKIELSRIRIETAQKSIERSQALGNYYLAYFRLLNSIGIESLDSSTLANLKRRISESFDNHISGKKDDIADYEEDIAELNMEIAELKSEISVLEKTSGLNNTKDEIKSQVVALESKKQNLTNEYINTISDRKRNYRKQLVVVESNIKNYNLKIEEYNKTISEMKKNNKSSGVEIGKIKNSLHLSNEKLEETKKLLTSLKKTYRKSITENQAVYDGKILGYDTKIKAVQSGDIEEIKKDIADLKSRLADLVKEKQQLQNEMDESKASIKNHTDKLEKYSEEIAKINAELATDNGRKTNEIMKKYDEVMAIQPDAVDALNVEMQRQSSNDTISDEALIPGLTKNIDIEAQKDAYNNNLNRAEFNPLTQPNIIVETEKDANNNALYGDNKNNGAGFNEQLQQQTEQINNGIQNQMSQDFAQPGRSGN